MIIDWFTIFAQVLNFLILVWLMKRFLYKPILNAIDAREKRITTELANADKKKSDAQKESDEFKRKNKEFEQQRAALLSKATEEAQTERERLLDEAREAAVALSLKRQETLRNEEDNLHQAIRHRTQQEVFAITRKVLADLAGTSLEERVTEMFTQRLHEMNNEAKESLVEAQKNSSDPVLVHSAFDLPAEQHTTIQNAINKIFSAEIQVRFETAPDVISGIELTTNGQKVAWSIADYLTSLEKAVDELLKKKDKAETKGEPESKSEKESKPEIKAETKPEIKNKPEVKAELKPEVKKDPKVKDEFKHKTEEPKPETKNQ